MEEIDINQKRIRTSAPYRKSMSMTEIDVKRALELERVYNTRYPDEAPFNFSKTISKALEIACMNVLVYPASHQDPTNDLPLKTAQQLTTGQHPTTEQKTMTGQKATTGQQQKGKPKKFQKPKRRY